MEPSAVDDVRLALRSPEDRCPELDLSVERSGSAWPGGRHALLRGGRADFETQRCVLGSHAQTAAGALAATGAAAEGGESRTGAARHRHLGRGRPRVIRGPARAAVTSCTGTAVGS